MSSQPVSPLLTVADYLQLGEPGLGYSEFVEGQLVMAPSPLPDHSTVARRLANALELRLPPGHTVLMDTDVDLQLAPPVSAGTVRRPDVLVLRSEAVTTVRRNGGVIGAKDVLLVVEVLSPSSVRIDTVHKRADYADAGIPHYWIVDPHEPVSLVECHMRGEFGYLDGGVVTGVFVATTPFPAELDLDALL